MINPVNYLSKPLPPNDECYYEEDSFALNERWGVSGQVTKALIRKISPNIKETKLGSMVTINVRDVKFEKEITIAAKIAIVCAVER